MSGVPWCEDLPQGTDAAHAVGGLTRRERQVAAHVAQGRSNAEIAVLLDIRERTVEFHLGNAYRKLGLFRRAQLAAVVSSAQAARERAVCRICGGPAGSSLSVTSGLRARFRPREA